MKANNLSKKGERGHRSYLTGLAAEDAVARAYLDLGAKLLETRWRGQSGEIDLIFIGGGEYIFCEVKAAKNHARATERLQVSQAQRIHAAASEYLENTPKGQLSDVRFDLAVVDGAGRVHIAENAFGHF